MNAFLIINSAHTKAPTTIHDPEHHETFKKGDNTYLLLKELYCWLFSTLWWKPRDKIEIKAIKSVRCNWRIITWNVAIDRDKHIQVIESISHKRNRKHLTWMDAPKNLTYKRTERKIYTFERFISMQPTRLNFVSFLLLVKPTLCVYLDNRKIPLLHLSRLYFPSTTNLPKRFSIDMQKAQSLSLKLIKTFTKFVKIKHIT